MSKATTDEATIESVPLISRGRLERLFGETTYKKAQRAGVVAGRRSGTGREHLTMREARALALFAEKMERAANS